MKFDKPHIHFWISSILIFIISFFYYNSKETEIISFNIHDTYYLIEISLITNLVSVTLFIVGLTYWGFIKLNIKYSKLFNIVHFITSIGTFFLFIIGLNYFKIPLLTQNNKNFPLFDDNLNQDSFNSILFIIFFLIQIIFVINLIASILRHFLNEISNN